MQFPEKSTLSHPRATLSRGLLAVLAIAAGLTVANNYYNQAMLGLLADEFQLSPATVALLPTLTQLGNVAGILLLAPLGDRLERRRLIAMTMAALIIALSAAALAPGFAWLVAAGLGIGLFATVTQQIVPLAVHLASAHERGRVLGIVTGGILAGILLARTFSGLIGDHWGWRVVYCAAAGLMLVTAAVLGAMLPRVEPASQLGYSRLLGSLWTLLRAHPVLRRAIMVQALIFAAFIGFWSNLAFLLSAPPYSLGATAVGLMALVGVVGVFAAPVAGILADRRGPAFVVSTGSGLVIVAFAIFGLFQGSLVALAAGVFILDLAVQSSQVANQARVFALDATARSRLNTIFMATMIFGGACGSFVAGLAYAYWGWTGTCVFGAATAGMALLLSLGDLPAASGRT